MRKVPKKDLSLDVLLETILDARRSILCSHAISVTRFYERKKKGNITVCPGCGEAYPTAQGSQCRVCQGDGYYELQPKKAV
jgi:formylmethanofuran dehydrogenase subunit E